MESIITTITPLPPIVKQLFDGILLQRPCPKFCDDCETLWKIYLYICSLIKKLDKHPIKLEKSKKLQKTFLELYERAKTKENELQKKGSQAYKRFGNYINLPHKGDRNLFTKLGFKSYKF